MTHGIVFRLIRPTLDLWELSGRPHPNAFRPDAHPHGLSVLIPTDKVRSIIKTDKWKDFGVYRLDVARLIAEVPQLDPSQQRPRKAPVVRTISARISYDPNDDFDGWGEDHVEIFGIPRSLCEWVRDLAEEERPPGKLRDSINSALGRD